MSAAAVDTACPCQDPGCPGFANTALREIVERRIREFGPTMVVTRGGRSWDVPRQYVALHGVPVNPNVFRKLGFTEREAGHA